MLAAKEAEVPVIHVVVEHIAVNPGVARCKDMARLKEDSASGSETTPPPNERHYLDGILIETIYSSVEPTQIEVDASASQQGMKPIESPPTERKEQESA